MALVKGKAKTKQQKREQDPCWPYLKSEYLAPKWRVYPFIYFVLFFVACFFSMMGYLWFPWLLLFPWFITLPLIFLGFFAYYAVSNVLNYSGKYSYWMDGFGQYEFTKLLPPNGSSCGIQLPGTQMVSSRYLIAPGPRSTYNGAFPLSIAFFPTFFLIFLLGLGLVWEELNGISNNGVVGLVLEFTLMILAFIYSCYFFMKYKDLHTRFPVHRFFIFDRKNQTVKFHNDFLTRRMSTLPWYEFEARTVMGPHGGYKCTLIHAPTGRVVDLKGNTGHWNRGVAEDAYSYVAHFMDLSQPLPNEPEFERYFHKDNISGDQGAVLQEREQRHNEDIGFVNARLHSWETVIEEHPWLSAKNVWKAAHKYNREPNWDKWLRDKWGFAANDIIGVENSGKEPEWFDEFYAFLKNNHKKLQAMNESERLKFTQEYFEEMFPEEHWVDSLTANFKIN